jgi:hypothetical protein
MATRAEQFRHEAERRGPKKTKRPTKAHTRDPKHTDTRHVTKRGDTKVGMALEDSTSGKPSRVSTRASSNHGRSDTELMRAARTKSQTPKAVAQRAKVARR